MFTEKHNTTCHKDFDPEFIMWNKCSQFISNEIQGSLMNLSNMKNMDESYSKLRLFEVSQKLA